MDNIDVVKRAKEKTKKLIELGELELAKGLIEQYKDILVNDIELYNIRAVIEMIEGNMNKAEEILLEGYELDNSNFDLLYNLGYLNEALERYNKSIYYYYKSLLFCNELEVKKEIDNKIYTLKTQYNIEESIEKKIVFFVKAGMDTFLKDIIYELNKEYVVKKVTVERYNQIDDWMKWADVCWFEWCDELVIYGSKLLLAREKKIICRLHSYEAFTNYPREVNWANIDKAIFVSENIRTFAVENFRVSKEKTVIIPNGLNLDIWNFKIRKPGFNIAYVGYINYKKGPMLLLHVFKAIYDQDNRYKLYIAGKFQDARYALYFQQMVKEFGLENNFYFDGWQDNLDQWLEDKNYILCTSILESQNMSVMQAMAKGIKPIIHNFVGAKNIYSEAYVWNTINESIRMIMSNDYNSNEYREFIKKNYSLEKQIKRIKFLIEDEIYINKN